eukprot:g48631.t1
MLRSLRVLKSAMLTLPFLPIFFSSFVRRHSRDRTRPLREGPHRRFFFAGSQSADGAVTCASRNGFHRPAPIGSPCSEVPSDP